MTVSIAVDYMLRSVWLIGQNTEHTRAMAFIAEAVAGNRLRLNAAFGLSQYSERLAGDLRASTGVPAAAGVESCSRITFVEHDDNGNSVLLVFPNRGVLNLADQVIRVVVTSINDRIAAAIAGRNLFGRPRNG